MGMFTKKQSQMRGIVIDFASRLMISVGVSQSLSSQTRLLCSPPCDRLIALELTSHEKDSALVSLVKHFVLMWISIHYPQSFWKNHIHVLIDFLKHYGILCSTAFDQITIFFRK